MKRFLLIGAMAAALSGCVSDYPDGGPRYDPYPGAYDARPVRVYRDRYRPAPIYRDDRLDGRRSYREPYRDDRRSDRRYDDRGRYDRNSERFDRRDDRRTPDSVRSGRGGPDRGPQGSGDGFQARVVTGQAEGVPAGQNCQQGLFNDCGGTSRNAGPQPYRPPVSRNN